MNWHYWVWKKQVNLQNVHYIYTLTHVRSPAVWQNDKELTLFEF